jgi:hypothetical protein
MAGTQAHEGMSSSIANEEAAGLSQMDLDRLCVGEDSSESEQGDDQDLAQARRCRFYRGAGYSQEELDAMCIAGSDDESVGSVEAQSETSPCRSSDFLLRIKRTRSYLGNDAADALITAAVTKLERSALHADIEDETTSASGSLSPPQSASSRGFSGLSQAELDTLCTTTCELGDECNSVEEPESLLLQVRRKRCFISDEAAENFASDIMAKAEGADHVEHRWDRHASCGLTEKGKGRNLCIDIRETEDIAILLQEVPTPQQKTPNSGKLTIHM